MKSTLCIVFRPFLIYYLEEVNFCKFFDSNFARRIRRFNVKISWKLRKRVYTCRKFKAMEIILRVKISIDELISTSNIVLIDICIYSR